MLSSLLIISWSARFVDVGNCDGLRPGESTGSSASLLQLPPNFLVTNEIRRLAPRRQLRPSRVAAPCGGTEGQPVMASLGGRGLAGSKHIGQFFGLGNLFGT